MSRYLCSKILTQKDRKRTLTETVNHWEEYLPKYLPMPHPSPRNGIWMWKNPWFEKDIVPFLKKKVEAVLKM
ncbi:MAG: uracil-DNA glycosylase [Paraglaciecola sp.]|jgi:uracil-DNA glycosylase